MKALPLTMVCKGREPLSSDTGIEKKRYHAEYRTPTVGPPRIANVALVTAQYRLFSTLIHAHKRLQVAEWLTASLYQCSREVSDMR